MFEKVEILAQELGAKFTRVNINRCPGFVLFDRQFDISTRHSWVWYAPTFADRFPYTLHAWMFGQFLAEGMVVAGIDVGESYGNPQGRDTFSKFYSHIVKEYNLSKKASLLPQSRGGLMLYNWAVENPEKVACVAGIYPVCDISSYPGLDIAATAYSIPASELEERIAEHNPIDRIEPLAKAKVPIFHVHGDEDEAVPLERNSGEMARRYQSLGGSMEVLVVPGKGHDSSDVYFKCQRLVNFILKHNKYNP